MVSTVDATARKATVGRTAGVPFRQRHNPVPLCQLDPFDLAPSVRSLIAQMAAIEKARNCGAYLFVDPKTGQAYVVSEERSIALVWVRDRFGWLVGFYSTRKVPGMPLLKPTADGLREDILDHLGVPA